MKDQLVKIVTLAYLFSPLPTLAESIDPCDRDPTLTGCSTGLSGFFKNIAETLIFLTGAIAVIMLIIGGFRYVISQGNPSAVEGAKNTILFAIIGLIVTVLAFALVRFVARSIL